MNITPGNSDFQRPYGGQNRPFGEQTRPSGGQTPSGSQAPKHELSTKHHYRRRDYDSKIYCEGLGRDTQNFIWNSSLGDTHPRPESEGGRGQETLDPDHEKVSDPDKAQPKRKLPDDDEDTIEEPTREVDDPYRPGHGEGDDDAPMEEESQKSDPKENIETDY